MQNTLGLRYNNLRKFTINLLVVYLMCTVFERRPELNFLSSIGIYAFLGMGMLYICFKNSIVGFANIQIRVRGLLGILVIVSLLTVPESIESVAIGFAWRFLTSIVIAFVISNIIYTEKDVQKVMFGFCAAGAFLSLNFYITYSSEILTLAQKVESFERMGREYGNINEVAQRCMFAFIISSYYAFFNKNIQRKWKYLSIANGALCFSVIMFTGSRRALIVAVVSIVVMILETLKNSNAKNRLSIGLKAIILFAIIMFVVMNVPMFANIKDRIFGFFETFRGNITLGSGGDLNRIRYIIDGFKYFTDNLLLGGGVCYSYYLFGTYTHNNYIEMLVNFGIVGFVIYYAGYLSNLIKIVKLKHFRFDEFKTIFFVLMISIMLVDVGVVSYYERYMCIILSLISSYFTNKVYAADENVTLTEESIDENIGDK